MKSSLRRRLRYRFENFMSRGWISVFVSLLVLFAAFLLLAVVLRVVVLTVSPEFRGDLDSWGKHFWVLIQEYTSSDVLELVSDYSLGLKVSALFTLLVGMVFFSMLIAFINTRMENVIYNFRKGRSAVIESDHTLVLGWNERVFDLLPELIMANRSRSDPVIVVLAEVDKEEMDDALMRAVPDTDNTSIVTRTGSPTSLHDLRRVNAAHARSAVVLTKAVETDTDEMLEISDTLSLKTILALFAVQGGRNRLNIACEIFTERKRALIRSLASDTINCVNGRVILGKVLVQTSRSHGRSSGLSVVYEELFSYAGSEIYFFGADCSGVPFGSLYRHLSDGVPIGIHHSDGRITIRPPAGTAVGREDELIVVARDDSILRMEPRPLPPFPEFEPSGERYEKRREKELLLGWSPTVPVVIAEYSDYLLAGSTIDIMLARPSEKTAGMVRGLQEEHPHLDISLIPESPLELDALAGMKPFEYDNVMILAQRERPGSLEEVDADTLVILLLLRSLRAELAEDAGRTQIITQVMNADNQDLMANSEVDDFIVSNRMITMLLAQLSEQPRIKTVYDELFSEAGSEIYLKPAHLYLRDLPLELPFGSIMEAAMKRDEICIGVRESAAFFNPERNFGIILNPDRQRVFRLDRDDTLVVIAEDES